MDGGMWEGDGGGKTEGGGEGRGEEVCRLVDRVVVEVFGVDCSLELAFVQT